MLEQLRFGGFGLITAIVVISCGPAPSPEDGGTSDGGADAARPDAGHDAGGRCADHAECDDGLFCNGEERCEPSSAEADEDGCVVGSPPCLTGQRCEEDADTCVTECAVARDADGDGVDAIACDGTDCDDSDPDRFPGNAEQCDTSGHDEDCDPTTFGTRDLDGDLAIDAACCNGTTCGTDCNDLVRAVNPTTSEVCDGYDNNCDGNVDEGVQVEVWPDTDYDLHGDASPGAVASMRCPGTPGWSPLRDDCRDDRPDVHTAQVEICDGEDNDCDGDVDEAPAAVAWYLDGDEDGFGDASTFVVSCEPRPGYSLRPTDCDDTRADTNPSQRERCDGLDNDCNGRADYVLGVNDFEDDDGDGRGDTGCVAVGGAGVDCDDADPTSYPGATELCDRRDNDCNGMVDDGTAMGIWYPDADRDTYGAAGSTPLMSCDPIAGHITRAGDCDDVSALVHPNVGEPCDGVDNDCDERVDEGAPERALFFADGDGDGLGREDMTQLACALPAAHAGVAGDCDDADESVGERTWFADGDGDSFGAGAPVLVCAAPAGHVADGTDCDDTSAAVNPGATEVCNGVDDDCDAMIDGDGADTSSDPLHCGACGNACGPGEGCAAGVCESVLALDGGSEHLCALIGDATTVATTGGRVECWGYNNAGQLGDGSTTQRLTPVQVERFAGVPLADATQICAAANFSCAVRAGGGVVCWGANDNGQLGNGAVGGTANRASPVGSLTGVTRVACGGTFACAVTGGGEVWCWGANSSGQLGIGINGPAETTPVRMLAAAGTPLDGAIDVSADNDNTCVARSGTTQQVWCVGARNNYGIGDGGGAVGSQLYPSAVMGLPSGAVVELRSGGAHHCVRIAGQRMHCWGSGASGQLDRGATTDSGFATPMDLVLESPRSLALGGHFTCVAYTHPAFGDRVGCFGSDTDGQLGDGTAGGNDPYVDDVRIDAATPLTGVRFLAASVATACAALNDGSVVCWGDNDSGELGRGSVTASVPFANGAVVGLP